MGHDQSRIIHDAGALTWRQRNENDTEYFRPSYTPNWQVQKASASSSASARANKTTYVHGVDIKTPERTLRNVLEKSPSDRKMAESAFGQGSNTAKALAKNKR